MARKALFDLIANANKEQRDYASEFLTDFTYAIQKWDMQHDFPSSATVSPSSMKCPRGMVYKLLSEPKDTDTRSYQLIDICQNGSQRHEALQQMVHNMKSLGLDCEFINVKDYVEKHDLPLRIGKASDFDNGVFETHLYSDEYRASFLCDGIIKYKGKYYILEIKTESASKFIKQNDVMEEHKAQATAYSLFLRIPDIMFLYENRDILSKKAFIYTPSSEDKQKLQRKILDCIDCADKNIIPKMPDGADNKFCQYCNYKTSCDKDGKNKVERENVK